MIFITVGTEQFPFDRLIKIIDSKIEKSEIDNEVYGQIGNSKYIPKNFTYKHFISFDQMIQCIGKADIVISHAGIGSTLLCLNLGKIPILFPRRYDFKEHLDNHQMEFAEKIVKMNKVLVAFNKEELIERINKFDLFLAGIKKYATKSEGNNTLIDYLEKIVKKREL